MSSGDSCGGRGHRRQERWISDGASSASSSRSLLATSPACRPRAATPPPSPPPPPPPGAARLPLARRPPPASGPAPRFTAFAATPRHEGPTPTAGSSRDADTTSGTAPSTPEAMHNDAAALLQSWRAASASGAWSLDTMSAAAPMRCGVAAASSPATAAETARLSNAPTTALMTGRRQEKKAHLNSAAPRRPHHRCLRPSPSSRLSKPPPPGADRARHHSRATSTSFATTHAAGGGRLVAPDGRLRLWNEADHLCYQVAEVLTASFNLQAGDFTVHLHHPEEFLIIFATQELKDRLSGDHFIGNTSFSLTVRPWCKLAHAAAAGSSIAST
nr:uncharacterized protein LOC127328320 [Lolium perenne]